MTMRRGNNAERPTFLIIGAYKTGTTSLHQYLKQHPQVFMCVIKEIRFLTYAGHLISPLAPIEFDALPWPVQEIGAYEALFESGKGAAARGDVSPCYLAFPEQSILGIQAYVPHAKIIALLRQPAVRAYSSFLGLVRNGREEETDFRRALQLEAEGIVRRGDGRQRRNFAESFYHAALERYFQHFPREQLRIYLYDDLQANALVLMQNIFRFIGVDDSFTPDTSIRYNAAMWPRLQFAPCITRKAEHLVFRVIRRFPVPVRQYVTTGFTRIARTETPPLDLALRSELTAAYRDDIMRTQELIGRDLSHWLV